MVDNSNLPVMALMWSDSDSSSLMVLGSILEAEFRPLFTLIVCTVEQLLDKSVVVDLVFIGSYCGYDWLNMCALLDHAGIKRTGLPFMLGYLLNKKALVAPMLFKSGLKLRVIDGCYPRVVKRSDSCGSYDSYVVSNLQEEAAALNLLPNVEIITEPFIKGKEYSINFLCKSPTSVWSIRIGPDEILTQEKKDSRNEYLQADQYNVDAHAFLLPVIRFMSQFDLKDITRVDVRINETDNFIHVMDINNVACCNFELLLPHERIIYSQWLQSLLT